jgi:hypothetical protein
MDLPLRKAFNASVRVGGLITHPDYSTSPSTFACVDKIIQYRFRSLIRKYRLAVLLQTSVAWRRLESSDELHQRRDAESSSEAKSIVQFSCVPQIDQFNLK